MGKTISEMTQDELKAMIESIVEQKLLEILGDPDEGLEIEESLRDRLKRRMQAVSNGEFGQPLDDVAHELGLE